MKTPIDDFAVRIDIVGLRDRFACVADAILGPRLSAIFNRSRPKDEPEKVPLSAIFPEIGKLFRPLTALFKRSDKPKRSPRERLPLVYGLRDFLRGQVNEVRQTFDDLRSAVHLIMRPRPPKPVEMIWIDQLENLGPIEVQNLLDDVSHINRGKAACVGFIDAGVTNGKFRFPTRAYVERWLGRGSRPDMGPWFALAATSILFAAAVGAIPLLKSFNYL